MLNIDTRLLDLIPQIGAETLAILLLIAKRINSSNTSFPSRATLQKESAMGRDKVDKCLKILKDTKLLLVKQRKINGRLSTNLYTLNTDLIGVYIQVKNKTLIGEEDNLPLTDFQGTVPFTEFPLTENTDSIKYYSDPLSISNSSLSNTEDKNFCPEIKSSTQIQEIDPLNRKEEKKEIPPIPKPPPKPRTVAPKFQPPELPEIELQFKQHEHFTNNERMAKIEADKFFNYYESNGWKVGKNSMKNWKASVAGWISRIAERSNTIKPKYGGNGATTSVLPPSSDRSFIGTIIKEKTGIDLMEGKTYVPKKDNLLESFMNRYTQGADNGQTTTE